MKTFETLESEVRGYCRNFPTVFTKAQGTRMWDDQGREFVDFFAGAGVLNYGHNHPELKQKLLDYLSGDGIVHGLDMATEAKRTFLERFNEVILQPRGLSYKVQFPGPTGTNAIEAALKLARKVTGRTNVLSFTNGFHGMTLGALAITGNKSKRAGAGVPLGNTFRVPFDGYLGKDVNTLEHIERLLKDDSSGCDKPAAVILETVQAEGGVLPCSFEWLKGLRELTEKHGVLLIVDDIQVGCGRTGTFFSFEKAGIDPDIVCLSKSISGFGLPMALVLMKPEHDKWKPGEHNGTFRGLNLAFATATATLERYWRDDSLTKEIDEKAKLLNDRLEGMAKRHPEIAVEVRGRGLIQGIECKPGIASQLSKACFERGLIIETAGANDQVLKFLPALVIEKTELEKGLSILEEAFDAVAKTATTHASSESLRA